jgi:ribonuclease J
MINDGDILEFTGDSHPQVVGRIPSGRVAVDGKLLGDADDIQIRDRKKLAATGVIIAFVVVNHIDGSIANGPSLMQHGFLSDVEESDLLMLAAEDFAKAALLELNEQVRTDTSEVSEALRVAVRRFFRKETNLKPVVIPIVHEL